MSVSLRTSEPQNSAGVYREEGRFSKVITRPVTKKSNKNKAKLNQNLSRNQMARGRLAFPEWCLPRDPQGSVFVFDDLSEVLAPESQLAGLGL